MAHFSGLDAESGHDVAGNIGRPAKVGCRCRSQIENAGQGRDIVLDRKTGHCQILLGLANFGGSELGGRAKFPRRRLQSLHLGIRGSGNSADLGHLVFKACRSRHAFAERADNKSPPGSQRPHRQGKIAHAGGKPGGCKVNIFESTLDVAQGIGNHVD